MVAKLVRSSRAWSLVVFAGLSVGVVLLISHWGNPRQAPQVQAQIPGGGGGGGAGGPLFPAGLTPAMLTGSLSAMVCPCDHGEFCGSCEDDAVLGSPVASGAPGTKGSSCGSCSSGGGTKGASFGGLSQPGTQPQRNVAGAMNDVSTQGNSLIDNLKLSYYHSADDLLVLGPTGLGLRRYHRFQDISDVGSFGATVFSNFDLKLKLIDGSLRLFRLFDPQQRKPQWMATDSTETQVTDQFGQPLELRDAQGQATSDWSSIVTARLTTDQENVFEFELFAGCTNPTGTKEGRVVSLKDRRGRGLTLTYKTWTAAELQESPERQWQIDTVSDGNGRTLTMQYAPQQVGGRWVISQVSSSSGETVSYGYANQLLSSVTLGDGSVSTFAYSRDVASQCSVVEFFDAAAQGRHRRKQVYLSDHLMVPSGNTTEFVASAFAENAQSVRMVVDGDGQVSYFNRMMGGDGFFGRVYYEGGSRLKWVKVGAMYSGYFERKFLTATSTWDGTSLSITNVQFATESHARYDSDLGDQGGYAELKLGRPNLVRDDQGLVRSHEYGSNGQIFFTRFSDSTFEAFCYNDQGQITRHRDRLGRVTRNSYDARGNLLLKEVGLQDDPSNVTGDSNGAAYGGETYNRCALDDVQTPEYATYQWEYFPAGHANQFLLSAQIDANGNRTDYEYDAQQRLTKVIQPPDAPAGSRAETLFAYDAAGRLQTITDPEGHVTEHFYDGRNRVTQVLYEDGTTERWFYGTGNNAGLLVKSVDRRNVVTNYEYDLAGRKTRTVTAAALMDIAGNESPVSDPSVTVEEVCTYVPGTDLRASCVTAGDKTSYEYDYKNRLVATTVYPNANQTLTSRQHYVNNQLFATEDPYGRKKFYAYDATDGRLIRQIQATVPSVSYADSAAVLNKVRDPDGTPNSTSLLQDLLYDAEGQTTSMFDGRGIEHRTAYDSRGRTTEQIQAFGSAVAAKTQTIYDANGNVLETRSPRYFDANDSEGFSKCRTTMSYTGRNQLKTRTEAPGTPIEATESFAYDIAGRQSSHLDFRGHEWKTQHPDCCGRVRLTIDPLGHGTITHTDPLGNVTHTAQVADVLTHTNHLDPIDAKTYRETTTKYDERGRVIGSTTWLVARGLIDPANPPIAGDNGVAATDGLTTRHQYDEHLTDNAGLDQQFSQHLTGLSLGQDMDGSARLAINSAGERTLAISDGAHRGFRTVQLGSTDAALVSNTQTYDVLVTVANYGDVLETASANALGHTNRSRSDGAGRSIQAVDAENFVTHVQYDANGNRLSLRDPNNVGQDCVYDALNRDQQCADTQELLDNVNRQKVFNLAGQVVQEIDAKNKTTSHVYDARGRKATTTDRINATTVWTYDLNGNETSMTDAENQTTVYGYDQLNRRVTIQWPDHVAGTNPGDQHYGLQATAYDPAGRASVKTDQKGDTITLVYDLASRLTAREYRTQANSPSGAIADQDTFTHDAGGRMLTAIKGRYANTVSFTYADGRKTTESLTIFGQTYTVGYAYDGAGRESSLTYPDGSVVTRTHTARNQLQEVNYAPPGGAASLVSSFVYDPGRRETSRTYGNGITTNRSYQADNLVTLIDAANVETLAYTYDANKNPTAEVRSGVMAPHSWSTGATGFDDQNRLTNWSRTNGDAQSWQLSPVNDWQQFTHNGVAQTRTHGPTHEIVSVGATPLVHDNRGNLTQDDRGTLLTYDPDNMLSAFDANNVAGLKNANYHYDALGRRVAKTVAQTGGDATTVYVLANQQVVAEYEALATQPLALVRSYVFGTYIDEPLALSTLVSGLSTLSYFHANRQYSTYALTDNSGSVLEYFAYTPYGAHRCFDSMGTDQGTTPQRGHNTLFTGRTFDPESGLDYFRARYFSTTLGRFTTHDPILYPDGWNTFSGWFAPFSVDPGGSEIKSSEKPDKWPFPCDDKCHGMCFEVGKAKLKECKMNWVWGEDCPATWTTAIDLAIITGKIDGDICKHIPGLFDGSKYSTCRGKSGDVKCDCKFDKPAGISTIEIDVTDRVILIQTLFPSPFPKKIKDKLKEKGIDLDDPATLLAFNKCKIKLTGKTTIEMTEGRVGTCVARPPK